MAKKNLTAIVKIGGAIESSFRNMIGQTRSEFGRVGSAIGELTSRQRQLNGVIRDQERLGAAGSALRVQYANQELGLINRQIEALRRRQQQERVTSQNRSQNAAVAVGSAVGAAGVVGSVQSTLGVTVKESAAFNFRLAQIGTTARMSSAQVESLKQEIVSTSKESKRSLDQVTDGFAFLVAAGMDVATAGKTIRTLAKTATASTANIEDLAKAAFTLNDTLKIAPEDMQGALDILASAGKAGNVELKDMAKQLPVIGAGFQALQMNGREATVTMAAALQIARKGASDADEAANNMKNFIAKVMSPETLKKAKKEFGIDLYKTIKDAQSKGQNPFEASMQAIISATKGDQKALGELFGDMQVQNFLRPMIQNWDEYRRIKSDALQSRGEIDRDFLRMTETTQSQMDELGHAWQRLKASIGDSGEPIFGALAIRIGKTMDAISAFTKEHPQLVGALSAIAAAGAGTAASILTIGAAVAALKFAIGAGAVAGLGGVVAVGATLAAVGAGAYLAFENLDSIKSAIVGTDAKPVAPKLGSTTQAVSLGDARSTATAPSKPAQLPPSPPALRPQTSINNVTHGPVSVTINQQPGQDSKALADEVARRLSEKKAVKDRGVMYDMNWGY